MTLCSEVKIMADKEVEEENLLKELIENSKSQEDKFTAVGVVANQDSQKATNAIKSLIKKT